jgi:hypothetical protein
MNEIENIDYVICKACGKKRKFLNREHFKICIISYDEYVEKYGKECMLCEKTRNKIGFKGKKRPDHSKRMSGSGNPMSGKKRTDEEKELMSKNRKGKGIGVAGKYERTKEIRERISNGVAKAYVEGRLRSNTYKNGIFHSNKLNRNFYYRSSWEKFVLEYLDKHPNIEYFAVEPFSIKYFDPVTKTNKNYIPDFLVEFDCGIREIWEVKPSTFVENDETVKAKIKALNVFISNNNINIHNGFLITENEIEMMKTYDFIDRYA